jgi:diguanylate cyclase (GGDEF)-like protein
MEHSGRRIGVALAAAVSLAVTGVTAWSAGSGEGRATFAALAGGGFAAVLLPLGWLLGRHYDRIKARSERDSLTGSFNRGFMERCFERLSEQALRGNKRISVTIVDINDFKAINDTYGHRMGDRVLIQLAEALQESSVRGEIIGRWGGDEFLLLSPYAARGAANSLHLHIEECMERLSRLENIKISAAIGTAVFPEDGLTLDKLLHAADRSMYDDKSVRKKDEASVRLNA